MDHSPEDPHAVSDPHAPAHDAAHAQSHAFLYLAIGGVLLLCTGLTVGLSYVNFGTPQANIAVALVLATIKAGLVAAIFMHLLSEKWTIYRFLLITVVFVTGLFLLTGLAFHDPIRFH